MRAEVYWIMGPSSGRLGIAPRPRGGDWLEDEIRSWRVAGIDTVVSMLMPEETVELKLKEEEAQCRKSGIQFHALPIPDRSLPESVESILNLAVVLQRDLGFGKNVVVHCRQGIGRSSIMAAVVLVCSGEDPSKALEAIEVARGHPVPDTAEQRDWVLKLAEQLRPAVQQAAGSASRGSCNTKR